MGKFERGEAERLEMDLVAILNKEHLGKPHPCVRTLVDRVRRRFPNIIRAEFIGRSYDEPGNVKLYYEDKIAYLELKLLTAGRGTRANIGQNALTELGLFTDNCLSWQSFRERRGFERRKLELLKSYRYYQKGLEDGEEMARYLRDMVKPRRGEAVEKASERNKNNPDPKVREAAKIINKILELAREDKLEYIKYLKSCNQNKDNIKKFVILILLGIHKIEDMKNFMSRFDKLLGKFRENNYIVYRVYKGNCRIEEEDMTRIIDKLLKAEEYRVTLPEGETGVFVEFKDPDRNDWIKLLRIVFHWKNVFQGIKTPCLNIFDEKGLIEL